MSPGEMTAAYRRCPVAPAVVRDHAKSRVCGLTITDETGAPAPCGREPSTNTHTAVALSRLSAMASPVPATTTVDPYRTSARQPPSAVVEGATVTVKSDPRRMRVGIRITDSGGRPRSESRAASGPSITQTDRAPN